MEMPASSKASITEWLESLGLGEYADRFIANAIDTSILSELTEQDLKEMEIPLGHRRKILRAIATPVEAPLAAPAATPPPSSESPGDGAQRRQLTVMFVDLVGSTALSARLDPEDMRAVINDYQAWIAETVAGYKGTIARYMGDGALIYFGYPLAHEDDTEQAVHAGLALTERVPKLRADFDAQLRVGIATGTVVVGDLLTTGPGVKEHAVVGDTPNLAARLQTVAKPGTVAVCANTHRMTEGYFEYDDLGAATMKGFAEPVHVWQPRRPSGAMSRFEASRKTEVMSALGRDEELDLLLRRWRAAKDGDGRAVLLTGEPGIGKSHVVLALADHLKDEPHLRLTCYCSAHHTNSALYPFINQLERAAGFEQNDPPATKFAKLEALLNGEATGDTVALLTNLLSLPDDPRYPLPEMTPQRQKEATLAALSAHLDRLAERQPLVMVFEDVHWIDPTSLELLTQTVERLPRMRALLLMTARPEFTPPWPGHAHVSTLPLTRLSRRDGAALVKRVTGGKDLPEEVLSQILARTDGVPLFVEELTKTILESGELKQRDGQYFLEQPLPSLAIPTTLHASLMARLDRLASVREVAQIGAVIGREFIYDLLNAAAGLPKNKLDAALDQLVESELVFRRGTIPQAVFTFKHALVRDAAYAGLLKARRAQLHAALANAIEEMFPETLETQPETVAHHLTEAGLMEDAARQWLQAGKKASQRSANLEAIAHLRKGLDVVRATAAGPKHDRMELDFVLALGPCLIATQGPAGSDAAAIFARAYELCERIGDPPESLQVMFWLTTASVMRGELPRARDTITPLLARAELRGDKPALINATRGKAMILMFMGQFVEAGETIDRAYEVFNAANEQDRIAARAAGQDAGVADLALMSWTLWLLGKPDSAIARIEAALRRAATLAHPHTQAYAFYYASVLYALNGQPDLARRQAEQCSALAETHGFRQWSGLARAINGICTMLLSPSPAALDDVKAAIAQHRGSGYQIGITALYVLLCPVLQANGQQDMATDFIDRGLSMAEVNSERIFEAELLRLKAQGLSGTDAGQAEAILARAVETARRQEAKALELRAARDLAQIRIGQGRRDEARVLLAPICAWFSEGAATQDLRQARALLDTL